MTLTVQPTQRLTKATNAGPKGVGIDVVSIDQISALVGRYDDHSLHLLFTQKELDWCRSVENGDRAFALCFATKEAVGKALKTGLAGIDWTDIKAHWNQPQLTVQLLRAASIQAQIHHIQHWHVNWWEWDKHVIVRVLAF